MLSSQNKKPSALIEERLRMAREEAYRYATMQLARGDFNLAHGDFSTQEQIDAELKNTVEELSKLEDQNV